MKKNVVFAKGETYGLVTPKGQEATIRYAGKWLKDNPQIEHVETVDVAGLEARLAQGKVDVVVFFSRAEIEMAKKVAERGIKTILLTGLALRGDLRGVIMMLKGLDLKKETFLKNVLDS